MTERNIELKYEILKTRISTLIEEHADALALAQLFKKESNEANTKLRQAQEKISVLEGKLKNDIQKEEPRVTIIDAPVET